MTLKELQYYFKHNEEPVRENTTISERQKQICLLLSQGKGWVEIEKELCWFKSVPKIRRLANKAYQEVSKFDI